MRLRKKKEKKIYIGTRLYGTTCFVSAALHLSVKGRGISLMCVTYARVILINARFPNMIASRLIFLFRTHMRRGKLVARTEKIYNKLLEEAWNGQKSM